MRANAITDQKTYSLMAKAGFRFILYGLESASQESLDKLNKGETSQDIVKGAQMAKKAGLLVTGHFMLGYPGETRQTILATIKLACDLPFDFAQFYCAVPFPGSDRNSAGDFWRFSDHDVLGRSQEGGRGP